MCGCEKTKKFYCRNCRAATGFIVVLAIVVVSVLIIKNWSWMGHWLGIFTEKSEPSRVIPEIDAWFYLASGVAATSWAFIAWIHIKHLTHKKTKKIFLHIDKMWSRDPILKGRIFVEEMRQRLSKDICKGETCTAEEKHLCEAAIGKEILALSRRGDHKSIEEFICIRSVWNLLETVSYLRKKDAELSEWLKGHVRFYHEIAKPYIQSKQKEHPDLYKELQSVYHLEIHQ